MSATEDDVDYAHLYKFIHDRRGIHHSESWPGDCPACDELYEAWRQHRRFQMNQAKDDQIKALTERIEQLEAELRKRGEKS